MAEEKMCSSCLERENQSVEEAYTRTVREIVAGGIIGVEEEKSLEGLRLQLGLDKRLTEAIEKKVLEENDDLVEVEVVLSGNTVRIGREPFAHITDLTDANHERLRHPECCKDSRYVYNCYDGDIEAQITWKSARCGTNRIDASGWKDGEDDGGVRFELQGETYGPVQGYEATLFVTEVSNVQVSYKSKIRVKGVFEPSGLVIKYEKLEADDDLKVISSIEYIGRKVDLEVVVLDNGSKERFRLCDSWVVSGNCWYGYNIMAPRSCYLNMRIEGCGARVWTRKFTDVRSAEFFLSALTDATASRKAFEEYAPDSYLGTFMIGENAVLCKSGEEMHDVHREVNDISLVGFNSNYDRPEDEVQVSYFEVCKGSVDFNVFGVEGYASDSNFTLWCDPIWKVGFSPSIISAASYKSPSFGKCCDFDDEDEEYVDETCIHGEDEEVVLEGKVLRRFAVITTSSCSRFFELNEVLGHAGVEIKHQKNLAIEEVEALRKKWASLWAIESAGKNQVLGIDLSGSRAIGSVMVDDKPVRILIPDGYVFPSEYYSKDCLPELKMAFEMYALRETAYRTLKVGGSECVIAGVEELSLYHAGRYRDAARIAGLDCKRVIQGTVAASLDIDEAYSDTETNYAIFSVSRIGFGVAIVSTGCGVFEVKASRGGECGCNELWSCLETAYKECYEICVSGDDDHSSVFAGVQKCCVVGELSRSDWLCSKAASLCGGELVELQYPEYAIAYGAAVQGGILKGEVKDVLLLDTLYCSMGIELEGGAFQTIIEQNTTIPTKQSCRILLPKGKSGRLSLNFYEGLHPVAVENIFVGALQLDIPPSSSFAEVTIDVDACKCCNAMVKIGDVCKRMSLPKYDQARYLDNLPICCEESKN